MRLISQIGRHLRFGMLMSFREPGVWSSLLVVVPVMEVLPFLLMGRAFLSEAELPGYLYANMLWSFFASVVIECLLTLQNLSSGGKFDVVLLADGSVVPWLCGRAIGSCLMYLGSSLIACCALGLGLGYPVHALAMAGMAALSLPVTLALTFLVFGAEIRWGRTFHFINLAFDVLQVVSCVSYPMAALGALAPIAGLSPVTWVNEFLRTSDAGMLGVAYAIGLPVLALSAVWIVRCERVWRTTGKFGV